MMIIRLSYALLLLPLLCGAQTAHFSWSAPCDAAYEELLAFRMNSGESLLDSIEMNNPENVAPALILSDVLFIRALVEERPEDRARLYNEYRVIVNRLQDLSSQSTRRYAALGEVYLKRAVINIQAQNNLSAARDFYLAYRSLEKAYELDSTLLATQMGWGVVQIISGAIPDDYEWYANLIGITGDPQFGAQLLQNAAETAAQSNVFSSEFNQRDKINAVFVYEYFSMLNGESDERDPLVSPLVKEENLPLTLIQVERLIIKGESDKALLVLQGLKRDPEAIRFWYLDYIEGRTMVRLMRPNGDRPLLDYLAHFPGDTYKKSTAMYLSWYYLLNEDREAFRYYTNRIHDIGARFTGADKLAAYEAGLELNQGLLRARLAYDSGQLDLASSILDALDVESLSSANEKQEWHYRKARIAQKNSNETEELRHFKKVADYHFDDTSYFLPVSCIELGEIYLNKGMEEEARSWFNRALSYKNYPYASDYQRKAKFLLKSF